jgi:hypothetical protein
MNALTLSSLLSVRSSKALCFLLLIGLLPGCLHEGVRLKDAHGLLPPPPSESLRSELGTVWVLSSLAQPDIKFVQVPASSLWSRAGKGAMGGALKGCEILVVPAIVCFWFFPVCAVIGCVGGGTVGAISGSIYGAIAAEPVETVDVVMTTVRNTLMSSEIQQRVQDHVRELMTTRIHAPRVTSDESAAATRLETELQSIQLDGLPPSAYPPGSVGLINPFVRLVVTAQARLIRTHDKAELYVARFQYWGARMTVAEWESEDAQPLLDAIDRAAQALAEQIVDAVFLLYRVP